MTTAIATQDLPPTDDHGEIVTPPPQQMTVAEKYPLIAAEPFSEREREILLTPVDQNLIEIRPDGIIYLPAGHYATVLNRSFFPGAWALMPRSPWEQRDGVVYREYALFVHGRFVSEAVGAMRYQPNNPEMTWADCCEGAKTEAMRRCCKALGIASEVHDPAFREKWKAEWAIAVWRKPRADGKNRPNWRRKDREPFYDETGPVEKQKPGIPKQPQKTEASVQPQKTEPANGNAPKVPVAATVQQWKNWTVGLKPDLPPDEFTVIVSRGFGVVPAEARKPVWDEVIMPYAETRGWTFDAASKKFLAKEVNQPEDKTMEEVAF